MGVSLQCLFYLLSIEAINTVLMEYLCQTKTKTSIDKKSYQHEFISSCSLVSDDSRLIDTDYSAKRLFELFSYK